MSVGAKKKILYVEPFFWSGGPHNVLVNITKSLNLNDEISSAYSKYPHTKVYDCSINFAPVTIFNYNDMKKFK